MNRVFEDVINLLHRGESIHPYVCVRYLYTYVRDILTHVRMQKKTIHRNTAITYYDVEISIFRRNIFASFTLRTTDFLLRSTYLRPAYSLMRTPKKMEEFASSS